MKNIIILIGIIILFFVAGGLYFFVLDDEPKQVLGEPYDKIQERLESLCDFDEEAFNCNGEFSCEGQIIDIEAYTLDANNNYAMYRTNPGRAWLELVNYGDVLPKSREDYNNLRQNGANLHQVHIIEEGKGEELRNKIRDIESDEFIPVKIIIKNAIIVGGDMPTNDFCTRGVNFEAKAEDISFERIK
jgi:hypothetical protein